MAEYNREIYDVTSSSQMKQFNDMLKTLIDFNVSNEDNVNDFTSFYYDIHIYPEDTFIILEWASVHYHKQFGGEFKYVGVDQYVMSDVRFPDNSYMYVHVGDEEKAINEWLKENPGWYKNEWGIYVNEQDMQDINDIIHPYTKE